MTRTSCRIVAALTTLVTASVASAQVCVGRPSLTVAPVHLAVGTGFTDGAKRVDADVGFGNANAFANLGAGLIDYDNVDESATALRARGGLSYKAAGRSTVTVCPLVELSYAMGPNVQSNAGTVKTRQLGVAGGFAVGGVVDVNPGFAVVPNAFAAIVHSQVKTTLRDDSDSVGETGGSVGGGLTLLFNRVFAIVPSIAIPVGFDNSDPTFSIGVVIGFRGR
jgi:hypothetical protein